MDFQNALQRALHNKSLAEVNGMCKELGIERADVNGFASDGRCTLSYRELQQILTYLGYRLEKNGDGN